MSHSPLGSIFVLLCIGAVCASPSPIRAGSPEENIQTLPGDHDYFILRGDLNNCRIRFERDKQGRVAFLGGSITHNAGWRDMVCRHLQERFPETEFDFINAGIPSTGSTPGAFRLTRDVFARGQVDLLFEEAAVNDSTNGQSDLEQIRGMEGIVRHARMLNPALDVVILYFADPEKIEAIDRGQTPAVIANHEKVAVHYNVPSLDLARETAERIAAGQFTWKDDFRDLHPSPFGQRLYAASIGRLLEAAWREPLPADAKITPHPMPEPPLDAKSYFRGRLVELGRAKLGPGWKLDPSWRPADGAGTRDGFVHVPMLVAEKAGAELKLPFEGTAVGLFVAAGPDAGAVEFQIDGGPVQRQNLFTEWSSSLHLPWAYVLAGDLEPGPHELTLRVALPTDARSRGHAVRIAHFLAN